MGKGGQGEEGEWKVRCSTIHCSDSENPPHTLSKQLPEPPASPTAMELLGQVRDFETTRSYLPCELSTTCSSLQMGKLRNRGTK